MGIGFGPLTSVAVWILENRFPQVREISGDVDGIVVLGGGERLVRGQIVVGSAVRLVTAADLARKFPNAKVIFSGGVPNIFGALGMREAPVASYLFGLLGVDEKRIWIEDRAKNTRESAMFIAEKFPFPKSERWLLITSAVHVPRAVGAFRMFGVNFVPYPVDYSLAAEFKLFDLRRGMAGWFVLAEGAAREWFGLVAYRLAGYTFELLPSPDAIRRSTL
ncbi:YdcF family protein [Bradyrhizobium sp. RDI18]|uniref:YdcF family protein n=1 Tax=Bradyrhizobium sp. RDI18 TaxID=3367400 RepID=UPI0037140BCB